jgi:putative ABC transport system permease protein
MFGWLKIKSLDRKLLRDIWHLKGQILAIALVVACGIASFVMSMSVYNSLTLTQEAYYDRFRFADVFVQVKRAPESLKRQIANIEGVAQVQTRIQVDVTLDVPGLVEPATGRLISVPERNRPLLNDLSLSQGRYIEANRRNEVIISEVFAAANNLNLGDRLGAIINGRWQQLQIVGFALSPEYVYEVRGAGELYPDNRRFGILWMGREALGNAFDMDGAFNSATLKLMPGAIEADVIDRLDHMLDHYGSLGAYGRKDQISHSILTDEISGLEVMATMIPSLFLAIAAFLLHIVLSRLIATQREQIAILKAFGYSNWAIGAHYLKFVLCIIGSGVVLGVGVGFWLGHGLTQVYKEFYRFPLLRYEPGSNLILTAVLVSASAALVGGLMALRRAVKLPPAEAMRPEPPAQFRPTIIERLGLQHFFSPVGRIILRNLERKPIQALMSIMGIAIAISLLLVGNYMIDAVNELMVIQFYNVQREDVTLVFNEPRPLRVGYEVTHLPGVLRAEPFRSVPVKLRFTHHEYRTALMGILADGDFRQLLDRQLHTVPLPSDGIVLTTKLAEVLGITPGQNLTIEVMEGRRPTETVPVVGTVDELLGMSAYMDIHALNRMMQEGQTISGMFLAIDDNQSDRLYQRLKQIPVITGVSFRTSQIESFEEISARNLWVMTVSLIVFASIITFSVVYNAARIALSERSRELASLRIMGFTRAEIAVILLGEQAILTVAAIPVGLWIGYGWALMLVAAYNKELYRLPLVLTRHNYAFTIMVVLLAAIGSGLIIRRQLDRLDLIAVLKTRE